jgi:hypothetical protein
MIYLLLLSTCNVLVISKVLVLALHVLAVRQAKKLPYGVIMVLH